MSYPEHEKLQKVKDKSQIIGEFLEWLFSKGRVIAEYDRSYERINLPLVSIGHDINNILAEYYEIDEAKLELEKRDMLEKIRALNESATVVKT